MKILVSACYLSPYRGSEYSVAWNFITQMSKRHELVVLYGCSDEHLGDIQTMEKWLKTNSIKNVRFEYVKPNRWCQLLNFANRHGVFVYTAYIAFNVWQRQAYRYAKKMVQTERFDVVHMVGPIGYREPGYLWKLDMPYVWGPVGGSGNYDETLFYEDIPFMTRLKFKFRKFANNIQFRCSRHVKKALGNTDVLLTCMTEEQDRFRETHLKDSVYLPENGITTTPCLKVSKFENLDKFHIISVGRLDANKSVITTLKALTKISNKEKIVFDIVGDGPMLNILQNYVANNGLTDQVIFHGKKSRDEVFELFNNAHLHVLTSIGDANTTVIFEAMTYGVPSLTLDHCGMHDTINESNGIKIKINSYNQVVDDIALALDKLIEHPHLFRELAEGTIDCAKQYMWDNRIEIFNNCYQQAIKNYNIEKRC